ncbi:hypothetical protein ACT4UT_26920, partial [Bacillus sp. B-TM1]
AKKIGGDYVTVEAIYPPGADSHTFEQPVKIKVKISKNENIVNLLGMKFSSFLFLRIYFPQL